MDTDEQWMRRALEFADRAEAAGEVPVGAVVVKDGVAIGRGHNHPIGACDPTAHAEIAALRDASMNRGNYRLTGATLYSTVEPCIMCLGACLHARVERLVYAAADPKVGAVAEIERLRASGADFNHRMEVCGGVLAEEASERLHAFFAKRRAALSEG